MHNKQKNLYTKRYTSPEYGREMEENREKLSDAKKKKINKGTE